jgi:hypothetical protein
LKNWNWKAGRSYSVRKKLKEISNQKDLVYLLETGLLPHLLELWIHEAATQWINRLPEIFSSAHSFVKRCHLKLFDDQLDKFFTPFLSKEALPSSLEILGLVFDGENGKEFFRSWFKLHLRTENIRQDILTFLDGSPNEWVECHQLAIEHQIKRRIALLSAAKKFKVGDDILSLIFKMAPVYKEYPVQALQCGRFSFHTLQHDRDTCAFCIAVRERNNLFSQ